MSPVRIAIAIMMLTSAARAEGLLAGRDWSYTGPPEKEAITKPCGASTCTSP
jgi:hypothetical protein